MGKEEGNWTFACGEGRPWGRFHKYGTKEEAIKNAKAAFGNDKELCVGELLGEFGKKEVINKDYINQ